MDAKTSRGETPLDLARYKNYSNAVRALTARKPPVPRDPAALTPMDFSSLQTNGTTAVINAIMHDKVDANQDDVPPVDDTTERSESEDDESQEPTVITGTVNTAPTWLSSSQNGSVPPPPYPRKDGDVVPVLLPSRENPLVLPGDVLPELQNQIEFSEERGKYRSKRLEKTPASAAKAVPDSGDVNTNINGQVSDTPKTSKMEQSEKMPRPASMKAPGIVSTK